MKCPYCGDEMSDGILHRIREDSLRWKPMGDSRSKAERFWDNIGGIGALTAEQQNPFGSKIPAAFCPKCKKMIIDTDIVT